MWGGPGNSARLGFRRQRVVQHPCRSGRPTSRLHRPQGFPGVASPLRPRPPVPGCNSYRAPAGRAGVLAGPTRAGCAARPTRLPSLTRPRYGLANLAGPMTPASPHREGRHAPVHRARRRAVDSRAGDGARPRHRPPGPVGRAVGGEDGRPGHTPGAAEGERRVPGSPAGVRGGVPQRRDTGADASRARPAGGVVPGAASCLPEGGGRKSGRGDGEGIPAGRPHRGPGRQGAARANRRRIWRQQSAGWTRWSPGATDSSRRSGRRDSVGKRSGPGHPGPGPPTRTRVAQ